jgi:large subunit ribosomal protein L23
MSLFGRKIKTEDEKKAADKATSVSSKKTPAKVEPKAQSMKNLYSAASTAGVVKTSGGKKVEARTVYGDGYKILIKPLITEKVSTLGVLNKYVFAVARGANKIEVAKAVKEIYGIKPVGVNIINELGKKARYGRVSGKRKNWKKAIVTLPAGQTIKIYEGV